MSRKRVFSLLAIAIAASQSPTVYGEVTFEEGAGALRIMVDGTQVTEYVWENPEIPRPYFRNVMAPGGMQVTRNYPIDPAVDDGNDDHPSYHPGAWLAFGDINGADFWRNKARVRHAGFVKAPQSTDDSVTFTVLNVYQEGGDAPIRICEEACTYTFQSTAYGYLLTSQSVFTASGASFAFGDQEEMGFGVRLATPLTVRHGSGGMLNSAGGRDEEGTWGQAAAWCAGFNTVDGVRTGIMVMPNPDNFRPSWFHSRDYGLIVANLFGQKSMTGPKDDAVVPSSVRVEAGEQFELGFGLYVFSLPVAGAENLESLYTDYQKRIAATHGISSDAKTDRETGRVPRP